MPSARVPRYPLKRVLGNFAITLDSLLCEDSWSMIRLVLLVARSMIRVILLIRGQRLALSLSKGSRNSLDSWSLAPPFEFPDTPLRSTQCSFKHAEGFF